MVDVLLAHSNFARLDPKQVEAGRPYLPLGTLYAAAEIRRRGFTVALFDATFAESPVEFQGLLQRTHPRAVILYEDSFNWLSKMCLEIMRDAALSMLSWCRDAGVPALAHGSDAADHPADYLRAGATQVAVGEGELIAGEWVERTSAPSRVPSAESAAWSGRRAATSSGACPGPCSRTWISWGGRRATWPTSSAIAERGASDTAGS